MAFTQSLRFCLRCYSNVSRTRAILCHSKNVKEIYYQYEDEAEAPPAESASDAAPSAPAAAPTGPVASVEDVPVKAIDILLVIVAQKLKKRIDEIPLSKTIKDLVGGKSMSRNEILGDLQQEFASAPEKGEELPLKELGSTLYCFPVKVCVLHCRIAISLPHHSLSRTFEHGTWTAIFCLAK